MDPTTGGPEYETAAALTFLGGRDHDVLVRVQAAFEDLEHQAGHLVRVQNGTHLGRVLVRVADDAASASLLPWLTIHVAPAGFPPIIAPMSTLPTHHRFEPDMVLIPAGEFLMGSDPEKDELANRGEFPQHTLHLPDYAIARTPVTNAQYAAFVRATRQDPPPHWRLLFWKRRWPPLGRGDHPVVNVTWHDALAYCEWLSRVTGRPYRLPNEPEWEKAARGSDGRIYPWGDIWDARRCHTSEGREKEDTTPVGAYPQGASPYGLLDMIGNVWEWTRSLWGPTLSEPEFKYPYDPHDGREEMAAGDVVRRVLRGGSFYAERQAARCASRYRYSPKNRFGSVGFRVVISPLPDSLDPNSLSGDRQPPGPGPDLAIQTERNGTY